MPAAFRYDIIERGRTGAHYAEVRRVDADGFETVGMTKPTDSATAAMKAGLRLAKRVARQRGERLEQEVSSW